MDCMDCMGYPPIPTPGGVVAGIWYWLCGAIEGGGSGCIPSTKVEYFGASETGGIVAKDCGILVCGGIADCGGKDCGGIDIADCGGKDVGGGYAVRLDVVLKDCCGIVFGGPIMPGGADCITFGVDWGSMGKDRSDFYLQPATSQR